MTNNLQKEMFAGIDVGSNTIRLLIGYFDEGKLKAVKKSMKITRLGRDFYKTGIISEESKQISIDTLAEISNTIKHYNARYVSALATGVLRKAGNSDEFVDEVHKQTGLKINIISGETEACLTALGVNSIKEAASTNTLIFDVGGASTEFILSKDNSAITLHSIDIGAVTLIESFIKSDPPKADELKAMNEYIYDEVDAIAKRYFFSEIRSSFDSDYNLIFTAGTATTLAAMNLKMGGYDPDRINNYILKYDEVKGLYDNLITMDKKGREGIIGLEKGREDVIISGGAIALNVMRIFNKDNMIISDADFLEGIVIDCYNKRNNRVGCR